MMLLAASIPPWGIVLIVIIVILIAAIIGLSIWGRKLERQQNEAKRQMDAMAQTVSALIIDKKMKKIKESGLPPTVIEQVPKYMRGRKLPIVKAKVGPKVVTLIADNQVYDILPIKSECKVVVSGLYITELKSVRGGSVPKPTKKKSWLARTQEKLFNARSEAETEKNDAKKKKKK